MIKLEVGKEYTLIDINHKNQYGHPKTPDYDVSYFKVHRVGRKYAYGRSMWNHPDYNNELREATYETSRTIKNYIWIEGIHEEYRRQYKLWKKELDEYNDKKNRFDRDIMSKYKQVAWDEQRIWREENPSPMNPIRAQFEKEELK